MRNETQKNKNNHRTSPVLAGLALCSMWLLAGAMPVFADEAGASAEDAQSVMGDPNAAVQAPSQFKPSPRSAHNGVAVIAQIGAHNAANVAQARNKGGFSSGNYAGIYQNGRWNEANIIQSGGNNAGLIGQIGDRHHATIEQYGNSFEARINQAGYRSDIAISQSGSGLRSIAVGQTSVSGFAAPVAIRTY